MQVVEQELARIPRQLGSLVNQQLWSILYMPQVTLHCLAYISEWIIAC